MLLFRFLLFFKFEYVELKVSSFFDLRRDPVIMVGEKHKKRVEKIEKREEKVDLVMMMMIEKEGKDGVWAELQKKSRENVRDFLLKFYLVIHYVCMV